MLLPLYFRHKQATTALPLPKMIRTPTKDDFSDDDNDDRRFMMNPATPAPVKARVNNLTNQVSELVRAKENNEKRHRAEMSRQKNELEEVKSERDTIISEVKSKSIELERCKAEGDGKLQEVSEPSVCPSRGMWLLTSQTAQSSVRDLTAKSCFATRPRADANNRARASTRASRG